MLARLLVMAIAIVNSYFKNIFSAGLARKGSVARSTSMSSAARNNGNGSSNNHMLQRIYNAVDAIDQTDRLRFSSTLSNPLADDNVLRTMGLIDSLSLSDIGIDATYLKDLGSPSAFRGYSSICLNVVEKRNFHISVFVLRSPTSKLPLHNHPNMVVLSKVLHGKLKMRSFSLRNGAAPTGYSLRSRGPVAEAPSLETAAAEAVLSESCIKGSADACWLLTPTEGNVHEFENGGEGPCVVLDVLLPPYDDVPGQRECSFFDEAPSGGLRLSVQPPTLPVSVPYRGFSPR